MSLTRLNPGDLIVIADLEKSNVWEVLPSETAQNTASTSPNTVSIYRLRWKPTGLRKPVATVATVDGYAGGGTEIDLQAIAPMVKKIHNKRWFDFLYDRDPWDFFTKMEYFHNKYPVPDSLGAPGAVLGLSGIDAHSPIESMKRRAIMQEILDARDLEILNWYIFNKIVPMQDQINDLVQRGDLQCLRALYTRDYKPENVMLDWAIESQYTKIIEFLILIELTPSQGAVNWCCKYGAPQNLELLLIGGFFPDSIGVQYILDSGDLYKLTLMDIFNLRLN